MFILNCRINLNFLANPLHYMKLLTTIQNYYIDVSRRVYGNRINLNILGKLITLVETYSLHLKLIYRCISPGWQVHNPFFFDNCLSKGVLYRRTISNISNVVIYDQLYSVGTYPFQRLSQFKNILIHWFIVWSNIVLLLHLINIYIINSNSVKSFQGTYPDSEECYIYN